MLDVAGPESLARSRARPARRGNARQHAAHRRRPARAGPRLRARWPNASPRARRSRPRCSTCSSTTTASIRKPACDALGITLTPLDETLRRVLRGGGNGEETPLERARRPPRRDASRRRSAKLAARGSSRWRASRTSTRASTPPRPAGQRRWCRTSRRSSRRSAGARWLALMIPYSLLVLPDRLAGALARRELVQRARSVPRHPARAREHLHPVDPERAGRQGRDGVLPEPTRRRAGLAGRLEHALHHVLRVLLPAQLGDAWARCCAGTASPRRSACCRGSRSSRSRFFVVWVAVFPRCDRAGLEAARTRHLRVPAGEAMAIRRCHRAAIAGAADRRVVYSRALRLFGIESSFVEMLGCCR